MSGSVSVSVKKIFLTMMLIISCAANAANTVTGNNGDVGDPNNAAVAAAANTATLVIPPPAAESAPTVKSSTRIVALASTPTVAPDSTPSVAPVSMPTVAPAKPSITAPILKSTASESFAPPVSSVSVSDKIANSSNAFGNTNNGRLAFTQMVRNLMPLNPDQITTLRNMFNKTQQAVTQYPGVPPKPTSSSILVNMSPGAAPPVIRLRAGYVTSLVFLDSTGQPWPVVGYDLGNPKAFSIMPTTPNGKGDTLMLQALERYQQGNLAVMLKGENTPVMLTLMPGQRAVDYRVDLRIPGLGPNATVTMSGLPQTESPVLMDFLDGVAPSGAKLLTIHGAPAQGWIYAGHLFLRTRVTVLSPGWISSMSSPDGTNVYELTKTPIILASERGQMIQLSIKGL